MALPFLKRAKTPIHQRIQSDDATRLRLKYDTYYHIKSPIPQIGRQVLAWAINTYITI
jgi:hypothetical protein